MILKSSNVWVHDPNPFYFQQFVVHHHRSAFKVNTDGVLLAAWANKSGNHILDIGTGSGVIALIAAQSNPKAFVTAIDNHEDSFKQSRYNFEQSSFQSRLTAEHISIQDYTSNQKFSAILCNPPFHLGSSTPLSDQLKTAKHSNFTFFEQMLTKVSKLLLPSGKCSLVFPFRYLDQIQAMAIKSGLHPTRICHVKSYVDRAPFNVLIELSLAQTSLETTSIAIYLAHKQHSPEYIKLHSELYQIFSAQQ